MLINFYYCSAFAAQLELLPVVTLNRLTFNQALGFSSSALFSTYLQKYSIFYPVVALVILVAFQAEGEDRIRLLQGRVLSSSNIRNYFDRFPFYNLI